MPLTIEVPDDLLQTARSLAAQFHMPTETLLLRALEAHFGPFTDATISEQDAWRALSETDIALLTAGEAADAPEPDLRPGSVRAVHLPGGDGGHAVVLRSVPAFDPMALVVPLTPFLGMARFPGALRLDPTPENGLPAPAVACGFAVCAIRQERLDREIGVLSAEEQEALRGLLQNLLAG